MLGTSNSCKLDYFSWTIGMEWLHLTTLLQLYCNCYRCTSYPSLSKMLAKVPFTTGFHNLRSNTVKDSKPNHDTKRSLHVKLWKNQLSHHQNVNESQNMKTAGHTASYCAHPPTLAVQGDRGDSIIFHIPDANPPVQDSYLSPAMDSRCSARCN